MGNVLWMMSVELVLFFSNQTYIQLQPCIEKLKLV